VGVVRDGNQRARGDHRQPLAITVAAPSELSGVRAAVRQWLRDSIADGHADEILLATGEALANALEHGTGPVTLTLEWVDDTLNLAVRDTGAWSVGEPASRQPARRGLGIPIMTALSDSLTFETNDGTTVKLSRRFGG
jgi:anti-sigma regulatory factor (Ser/Thr protein kinase)